MKSKKTKYIKKNYNQKQKTKNKKIIGGADIPSIPTKKRYRENNNKSSGEKIKNHRKDVALNTALSNIIKELSDAAVNYPIQENTNDGDKLLNFYGQLGDRIKELKNFKKNFNKSIKAVGNIKIFSKNSSNNNSLSLSQIGNYPEYTDDTLINYLDLVSLELDLCIKK